MSKSQMRIKLKMFFTSMCATARGTSRAGAPVPRGRKPLLALLLPALLPSAGAQTTPDYADVAPLLQQKCVMCHSGANPAAGLRLDSLQALLAGGTRGKIVIAGDPRASELLRRIRGESQPRMPMTGPPFLSDSEIDLIERWIAGGLTAGEDGASEAAAAVPPPRPAAGEKVTYLHVAPIFATRCAKCHSENGLMGPPPEGYRLDSYQATLASGDRVRVVPGNPAASELLRRIRGQSRRRMPLDGPPWLDADETRLIEDWIAQGAANAEGTAAPLPVGARVRLHGRLSAPGRLDDLELVIGAGTRIDKQPRPGNFVEVRGRIGADGRVLVERLRRRKD